jgi:DNA modification methylase
MADLPGPDLAPEEIQAIAARLERGEYLDDSYRYRLFAPLPREYELTYAGKAPRGAVLADTMGVPLQTLKRFGDSDGSGWANKLIFGDNLQALKTLLEMKGRGELRNPDGSDGFRAVYIDPPFSTRRDFRGSKGQQAYRDKVAGAEFIEFLRKRLIFIHELLTEDGTLYVHLDTKKGHYMKVVLDELFGASNFRNELIWHYYNKMQGNIDRFPSNHDCIYVYGKAPGTYFKTVMEEREETATLIKRVWDGEKGKHVNAKDEDGKVIYIERDDKRVDDVWRLSMLQPADRTERVDYPTQKPTTLLNIVLAASSQPGDLVLDAFAGSGTTAVTAERMGRRWVAIDSGKLAIYMTQRRLLSMKEGKGKKAKSITAQPFELCSAGLYDNELLAQLPPAEFKRFALELFGCVPHEHSIAGVPMHGLRRGEPAHLFPYDETDALMGLDYIESLHERVGNKVNGPLYIIAPASACDPSLFQDIVQLGNVTYYVLRIPYSVIEALHGRGFQGIDQPTSMSDVNDGLNSYGFDFMQPPTAEVIYERGDGLVRGRIASFARGGADPDELPDDPNHGRGDLSMVSVDADYDGDVFKLTHYWFADTLEESDWTFELDAQECGTRLLVICVDTHGNERREVIEPAQLGAAAQEATAAA